MKKTSQIKAFYLRELIKHYATTARKGQTSLALKILDRIYKEATPTVEHELALPELTDEQKTLIARAWLESKGEL